MTFKDYITELDNSEIKSLESYLDRIFAELDVDVEFTKHFIDRLHGREADVSQMTIKNSFNKLLKKYKTVILKKTKVKALLQDLSNNINIPFVITQLKDGSFEMDTLTIMRKKGFKPGFDTKKLYKVG